MRSSARKPRTESAGPPGSILRATAAFAITATLAGTLPARSGAAAGAPQFLRGDVNGDGRVLTDDALGLLGFLFLGNPDDIGCLDAMDADDSGAVDMTDVVFLLDALFRGGKPPPTPFPVCGEDPTGDPIDCVRTASCSTNFVFYGQELSATGAFFVVDRSGSMSDSGELAIAKREITRFLLEVEGIAQYGLVVFDATVRAYPADYCPANGRDPTQREEAVSFLASTGRGTGSCVQQGLLAALEFVECSTASHNVIIYVGDGGGTCGGMNVGAYLDATRRVISDSNAGRSEVYTFGVLMTHRTLQEEFLRQLAEANGGFYTRVDR